jgi:hypothetical protein
VSLPNELKIDEWQHLKMQVGAEILKNLSKGIYSNPGNTIKELINNSYDADATEVVIRARPEFDTITITDNGEGMNESEFKEDFVVISRSRKRDAGLYTQRLKRPVIGKIGIGFISALQICDEVTFISKKRGENLKLEAKIDFGKFKGEMAKKAKFQDISDVQFRNVPEETETHYTMVIMSKLSEDFKDILSDKDLRGIDIIDFQGVTFEEIADQIEKRIGRGELEDFTKAKGKKAIGQYWNMMLQIANTVPVPYLDNGPIKESGKFGVIEELKKEISALKFDVDFDGIHLKKPLRFPNVPEISEEGRDYDIYTFKEKYDFKDGSNLSFKGYIYNQRKSILPTQFRGIIIRIKNVAIGGFFPDFLDYPYSEKLWIPWTTGEIYVEEGLEEAMNIDRNTFNLAHPHYRKLKSYLHNLLHTKVFIRVRNRYTSRIEERKEFEQVEKSRLRKELLASKFGYAFEIKYNNDFYPKRPVDINTDTKTLIIYRFHPIFDKYKQKREFLEDVLILFEIAYSLSGGEGKKLREIFLDEIKRW